MKDRFLLAQVADMHLEGDDPESSLARCLAPIGKMPQAPDAVLFIGNLADSGRPEGNEGLARILSGLSMPCFLVPGQQPGKLYYVIDDYPVRIVALDSSVPKKPHGLLADEQLAWLETTLAAAPSKPTIVALHHPPFWTGIGPMDAQRLMNPVAFESVISRHPQVERVVCGHGLHNIVRRFGGTIASTCPSPPGFQLHLWRAGKGLVTHTAAIGDFAGLLE